MEFDKRQFEHLNRMGVRSVDRDVVTMTNGDEHRWMLIGSGEQLRGTEWDCVIVVEDLRRCVADRDYAYVMDLIPTRVRPK
jgi:hypothetical protein